MSLSEDRGSIHYRIDYPNVDRPYIYRLKPIQLLAQMTSNLASVEQYEAARDQLEIAGVAEVRIPQVSYSFQG